MVIEYLGHSSFLITAASGTKIITDPFDPNLYGDDFTYKTFNGAADIVTISHDHRDHSGANIVKGKPIIIRGNGKFFAKNATIFGVKTWHDGVHGSLRGKNTVFAITIDEITIIHFGDLGHILTADQAAEIGSADVAMVPIGGYYTIDAQQADTVVKQVDAKIVIPMHYKTEKCSFPIADVEAFINSKQNVSIQNTSSIQITKDTIPSEQKIIVLRHSL